MQVKTIQQMYDWTILFHTQMAANFYSVRELLGEHNMQLIDYCIQYEKKLTEDLMGFKVITEINTLDTYCYEYFAQNPELLNFTDLDRSTQLDEQAIQGYLSAQHQKVIDAYEYLAGKTQTADGKEKLGQILQLEQQGLRQMVQSINRHIDM
ncbi:hypothetical protein [Pseudoalteromonas sp.]|uniref:hypothetical protein n=1 Tax=Pseudoalteromonas sp. TaxID=53249 RepID=UPI003564DF50